MIRHLLSASVLLAAVSLPATAWAQDPCPNGDVAVVRTSKIKPGGSVAGFEKAAADHAKWYADHGYTKDIFKWGRVMTYDPATKMLSASPDMMMTIHGMATSVPDDKHDAAWDAYVAEYSTNSDIVTTTLVCISK